MEFRIATDELKKALYRAQGIVERKATMPILANVLISAGKSGVQVTAFDLDNGIVSDHPAEVLKGGAVTLSAKYLFDIAQNRRVGSRGVSQASQGGECLAGEGKRGCAPRDDQEDLLCHLHG